jgi:hypothetical protein
MLDAAFMVTFPFGRKIDGLGWSRQGQLRAGSDLDAFTSSFGRFGCPLQKKSTGAVDRPVTTAAGR